jgi:hypothetical protein
MIRVDFYVAEANPILLTYRMFEITTEFALYRSIVQYEITIFLAL